MERADDGGRVNIRDIVLYPAEPLYILAETLASLLGNDCSSLAWPWARWPPVKAPTNSWHKSDQEEIESTGKCINHDMALGLRANGK